MKKFSVLILSLLVLSSCSFRIGKKDNPLFEIKGDALDSYLEEIVADKSEDSEIEIIKEYKEAQEEGYEQHQQAVRDLAQSSGETVLSISSPRSPEILRTHKTEVSLWGDVHNAKHVAKIKVNDYSLFKYKPGQKKFNYIASRRGGTLERGENNYNIQAFDKEGNLLSEMEYKIVSDAKYESLTHSGPKEMLSGIFLLSFFCSFFANKKRA